MYVCIPSGRAVSARGTGVRINFGPGPAGGLILLRCSVRHAGSVGGPGGCAACVLMTIAVRIVGEEMAARIVSFTSCCGCIHGPRC